MTVTKPKPPAPAKSSTSATDGVAATTDTSSAPSAKSTDSQGSSTPWGSAKSVNRRTGLSLALFGPGGSGKTSLLASATTVEAGRDLLVINFDPDLSSIDDRDDIMAWPKDGPVKEWKQFSSFSSQLSRRSHPFKTVGFDTLNPMYDLAYKYVIAHGGPNRDGRAIFGEANELVLGVISTWTALSADLGLNVIFNAHSEEKQDGENGPLVIRMSITPGVVKGLYQRVSNVGCLLEIPGASHSRKLYLHNTQKIVAKVHQPRTGAQLPLEIVNPDLGRMIEHFKKIRPYPKPEAKK